MSGRPIDELALIFYVAQKGQAAEAVPPSIEFTPEGEDRPVELLTDVVETPPVEPEA